jgi:MEMO1 family protein
VDSRTRPAVVAGLFYPSDPDLLRTQIVDLLANFAAPTKVMPKALIAPHAGYAYSGRVAAATFATLQDSAQRITRVVLIGPAHYLHVHGIAAPTVDAFETPLGRVAIDVEALRKIANLPSVICHSCRRSPCARTRARGGATVPWKVSPPSFYRPLEKTRLTKSMA